MKCKDIPNWPGYRACTNGDVYSKRWGTKKKWKKLNSNTLISGHKHLNMRDGNKTTFRYVHRLILETFVGPCPKGKECCHYNGDPGDNRLSNLRWDTFQANRKDLARHGTFKGEKNPQAKLNTSKINKIRQLHSEGNNFTQIGKLFGVHRHTIAHIIYRRTWAHIKP